MRFPVGFHRTHARLGTYVGNTAGLDLEGDIRAVLFWPYLFPEGQLITSTGKFRVLIATGITQDEWDLAKRTTTAHLLLLLCRAGVGQRTQPNRKSVLHDARWRTEWESIEKLAAEACMAEFQQGIPYLARRR